MTESEQLMIQSAIETGAINLIKHREYTAEEERELKEICAEIDAMGVRIGGITLGDNADKLGVAREILASLKEIAAGNVKPLVFGDSHD